MKERARQSGVSGTARARANGAALPAKGNSANGKHPVIGDYVAHHHEEAATGFAAMQGAPL